MRRPDLEPSLDAPDVALAGVVEHVRLWQSDTMETIESLRAARAQVEDLQQRLESPAAALQFADFFIDFFLHQAADFDRVLEQLDAGVVGGQHEALVRMGATAAAEERRGTAFRDKWLNRPLPYEDVRPVLDRLSAAVRNQLTDYRNLRKAAARLEPPAPPPPPDRGPDDGPDDRGLDRRALFTKFFKR